MNQNDLNGGIAGKVGKMRWSVITVLFLLYTINLIDRYAVLTLLPLIRAEMNFTHQQIAMTTSVFFFVYAFAQAWSGWLSDKIGGKKVIYIGMTVFTFFTIITGTVKNFTHLLLARAGLALGEGHHWAPSLGMVAKWMPQQERGRATTMLVTSASVAPAFVPIVVTAMAAYFGNWRPVFYFLFIPGAIGLFLLWYFIADKPETMLEKGRLSKAEYDFIKGGTSSAALNKGESATIKDTAKLIFSDKDYWVFLGVMFLGTAVAWGNNAWMSLFLFEHHGLNLKTMGIIASLPFIISIVSVNLGGYLFDKVFKGKSKPLVFLSFIPLALAFYAMSVIPRGQISVLIPLMLSIGFFGAIWTSVYAFPAVRYPKEYVGTAVGMSQLIAQMGGFAASLICGSLVVKADWGFDHSNVMLFFAILSVALVIVACFFKDAKRIEIKKTETKSV